MIIELLVDFGCNIISSLFDGLAFFSLPINLISVLYQILCYGSWVVGADLLLVFASCVVLWWGLKATVGLGIFIWKLLPLT